MKARNKTLTSEVKEYKYQVNSLSKQLVEKEREKSMVENKKCIAIEDKGTNEIVKSLHSQLSYSNGERKRLERTVQELQTQLQKNKSTVQPPTVQPSTIQSCTVQPPTIDTNTNTIKLPPIKERKTFTIRNSFSAGNVQQHK